jgi:hypothetical protein
LTGKIVRDVAGGYDRGILRDMLIETPNGLRKIYRLQERELNSGIYLTEYVMEYKGFYIIKKKSNLHWVMCNGSVLGSAKNANGAKSLIDELTYCEV